MRSRLTGQVEQGEHFEMSLEECEDCLSEPNRLFLGYKKNKKRFGIEDEYVFENISEEEYNLVSRIISEQNGEELHGYLVILGLNLLVEHLELHESIREAFNEVEIEGRLNGQEPDIFDEENKVVIECGFINGFDERPKSFLDKCLNYVTGFEAIPEFEQYKFLHIPKESVKRNELETSVWNYKEDGKYLILEFKEKLDMLVDSNPVGI